MKVTLDTWGPKERLFSTIYDYLQANWGEHPSRVRDSRIGAGPEVENATHWNSLEPDVKEYVIKCFRGETLPQVLEGISFWFTFDGVTRPFTHQAVRTRNAAFMQHGGRDNDWRHRRFTIPETVARAIDHQDGVWKKGEHPGLKDCVSDWGPLDRLVSGTSSDIQYKLYDFLYKAKEVYAALVDAGIPWEDARRFLPMGFQTYLHGIYDWQTLKGTLANREEHIMDWEYNCVAQLMHREIYIACPMLGDFLGSHSDRAKKAMFAGLESWPPDSKWPSPFDRCLICKKSKEEHDEDQNPPSGEGLVSEPSEYAHDWIPVDSLERTHRPEQNPFWVLTEKALKGGPIEWIPTNGKYPHSKVKRETK